MSEFEHLNVLLVDDIKSMRGMIRGILFNVGIHKIHEAADGFEALSVLKQQDINLIVSDWNMPKMDGLELLKAVRADEKYKDIPFLMVTAENRKENVVDAIAAGTSEFIAKPFTDGTLREKLKKIIK